MSGNRRRLAAGLPAIVMLAVTGASACGAGNGTGAQAGSASAGAPAGSASQEPDSRQLVLPAPGRAWVIFGADTVVAEIASTPEQREQGLMDRSAVPDGTGMLFVFNQSEERSLWMKDTHVALDVAFFDDANTIVGIKQMEPLDETLTDSDVATALVLEVRKGWFAENGIGEGATAEVIFGPGLTVR